MILDPHWTDEEWSVARAAIVAWRKTERGEGGAVELRRIKGGWSVQIARRQIMLQGQSPTTTTSGAFVVA